MITLSLLNLAGIVGMEWNPANIAALITELGAIIGAIVIGVQKIIKMIKSNNDDTQKQFVELKKQRQETLRDLRVLQKHTPDTQEYKAAMHSIDVREGLNDRYKD